MNDSQATVVFSSGYQFGGVPFDKDGYLAKSQDWSRDTAELLARIDGIGELSEAHWSMIQFIRTRFEHGRGRPDLRQLCGEVETVEGSVARLFGSCRALWRLSGLPNPGLQAQLYMD